MRIKKNEKIIVVYSRKEGNVTKNYKEFVNSDCAEKYKVEMVQKYGKFESYIKEVCYDSVNYVR